MVWLPLLLLLSVVVILVRRHVVSLHGYLDWLLLVATWSIVLVWTLVSIVLVWPRRLLLHGLLLSKFGLSVSEAAFSFIGARILQEVLAKLCLVVGFVLGIDVGSPLILTVHAAHLLLHSLVVVVGTRLIRTWWVSTSALVSASAPSLASSLLVLPLVLTSNWLLLMNRWGGLILDWLSSILNIRSSTRYFGLCEVSVDLWRAIASPAALIAASHVRVISSSSTSSASSAIAEVLSV